MSKSNEINRLETLCLEANEIVSRHDGIHNLHGDRSNIIQWLKNAMNGIEVDWENVEFTMSQMRRTDMTGCYPKRTDETNRKQIEKVDLSSKIYE